MGYIRKKYQELLSIMDYTCGLPSNWESFINTQILHHNIIIKSSKKCICTNCKHEFKTKKKVNQYEKCPNCKQTYLIKRSNLKHYDFYDNLILLDKVEDELVLRYFDLWSSYDNKNSYYSFTPSYVEYARVFIDGQEVVNERMAKCQCHISIGHWQDEGKWREYTRHYDFGKRGIVFADNIKQILSDTKYKYSMIWELVKHTGYVNLEDLISDSITYPSFEFLVKLGLYNLALDARYINQSGNFENRFKVSKEFLPFMKKHNITYKQLEILQLLKEPDVKKVNYLLKHKQYCLEEICEYIPVNTFIKYLKMRKGKLDQSMYCDYLKFAKTLGFDLKNKRYVFPQNLKEEHDKLQKQYKLHNEKILDAAIAKRYVDLSKNIFIDDKYIIIPAKNVKDLIQESNQQNNCVRTYSEKYAAGTTDIYFMRKTSSPKKSLVTVEVRRNVIVQSRIKNNMSPDNNLKEFLQKWQNNVLSKVSA